jgi:hypothetical protein
MKKAVTTPDNKFIRYTLAVLLFIVAINAFGGGVYGMAGAEAVPTAWLAGSPFSDYFIPSLVLFIAVGGSALFAAFALLRRWRIAPAAAFVCGIILLVWITAQVAIIGYVSWMQPTSAFAGLLILLLTWQLSKNDH